jgi:hypothetical protein
MKRFRLSTLMLLVAVAALSLALVAHFVRASRREARLQARLAEANAMLAESRFRAEVEAEGHRQAEQRLQENDGEKRVAPKIPQ